MQAAPRHEYKWDWSLCCTRERNRKLMEGEQHTACQTSFCFEFKMPSDSLHGYENPPPSSAHLQGSRTCAGLHYSLPCSAATCPPPVNLRGKDGVAMQRRPILSEIYYFSPMTLAGLLRCETPLLGPPSAVNVLQPLRVCMCVCVSLSVSQPVIHLNLLSMQACPLVFYLYGPLPFLKRLFPLLLFAVCPSCLSLLPSSPSLSAGIERRWREVWYL